MIPKAVFPNTRYPQNEPIFLNFGIPILGRPSEFKIKKMQNKNKNTKAGAAARIYTKKYYPKVKK